MKKLIIAAILFITCSTGFAQTGVYSGGIWKDLTPKRKTGFVFRPEIGYNYFYNNGYSNVYNDLSLQTTFGYQIIPNVFVGGGLGLGFQIGGYEYDYGQGYEKPIIKVCVPIYVTGRYYILKTPSSPFIDMSLGVKLSPTTYSDSDRKMEAKIYCVPAIGYDIKNFDIKIQFPNLYKGVGIYVGYNITAKSKKHK